MVIAFKDVVGVDKKNTAFVFPNAIQIATLHHRYLLTSFVYRDEAFNDLIRFWKCSFAAQIVRTSDINLFIFFHYKGF